MLWFVGIAGEEDVVVNTVCANRYGLQALLGPPQGIMCGPYVGEVVSMSCICCLADSVHRMARAVSYKLRFASAHKISFGSQSSGNTLVSAHCAIVLVAASHPLL